MTRRLERARTRKTSPKKLAALRVSKARLKAMIEKATVDCHDESEQVTGWYTMIQENLAVPFETTILGLPVSVDQDANGNEQEGTQ